MLVWKNKTYCETYCFCEKYDVLITLEALLCVEHESRLSLLSLTGVSCAEPGKRPSFPSPRGDPLWSLRGSPLCRTREEALFAEPEKEVMGQV